MIPFEEKNGSVTELSAGQAFNRMMGDPDKEVRQRLFTAWEKAWSGKASILADTLNHLDGFRLSDYKLHGTTDYLENPLNYNRMSQETLTVMWETIQKNKQPFVDFLTRKAQLFGKEKMDWQDQDAPIILGDLEEKTYSFDQAASVNSVRKWPILPKWLLKKVGLKLKIVQANVLGVIVQNYLKHKNHGFS